VKDIPIYDYKDITELGQESRNSLLHSRQQGTFLHDIVIWYGQVIKWQCA
jgi:hypothetical protein